MRLPAFHIVTTDLDVADRVTEVGFDFSIRAHRTQPGPFDVAISGSTDAAGLASNGERLVPAYAAAGASWYYECLFATRGSHAELLARIHAGPPRGA